MSLRTLLIAVITVVFVVVALAGAFEKCQAADDMELKLKSWEFMYLQEVGKRLDAEKKLNDIAQRMTAKRVMELEEVKDATEAEKAAEKAPSPKGKVTNPSQSGKPEGAR